MNIAVRELTLFCNALTFLTRLPAPPFIQIDPKFLTKSVRYFPLVGVLVGSLAALSFVALQWLFPLQLAVLLSMAVTVLATGGFHEDGLADSCDGFGGGYLRQDILTIMKDSRIGTFAALGMFFVLAIKWTALVHLLDTAIIAMAMIIGHGLSRLNAIHIMALLPYIEGQRTVKIEAVTNGDNTRCLVFAHLSLLAFALLAGMTFEFTTIALLYFSLSMVLLWSYIFFKKRLQGYTGDCLGAVQQMSELVIYLVLLAAI